MCFLRKCLNFNRTLLVRECKFSCFYSTFTPLNRNVLIFTPMSRSLGLLLVCPLSSPRPMFGILNFLPGTFPGTFLSPRVQSSSLIGMIVRPLSSCSRANSHATCISVSWKPEFLPLTFLIAAALKQTTKYLLSLIAFSIFGFHLSGPNFFCQTKRQPLFL